MTLTSGRPSGAQDGGASAPRPRRQPRPKKPKIQKIPVARIRPEEGLGRKRDRDGHRELRRSIEQFGVLTPITVRPAPDCSGDYLLIKGQGRTLACQMLGLEKIPAIVVAEDFAEDEKVQQFLVENVARLRMRPVDRALLITRARQQGEETVDVARRFGVTPATVRRLEAQLDGATKHEVAALKDGTVNLTLHAVIARHVSPEERSDVVAAIAAYPVRTKEVAALFAAFGWKDLVALGSGHRTARLQLIAWACHELSTMEDGALDERLRCLAELLPTTLSADAVTLKAASAR
jgi:ParB/RepB/Spo0J family partition protein